MENNLSHVLRNEFEDFLGQSSKEDQEVLSSFFRGLREKQKGNYVSYIGSWLETERSFLDDGTYEVSIPIKPSIMNALNIVHGGVTATLLDTTMGSMVNLSLPEGQVAVTLDMKVNYIKGGTGNKLRCQGEIISRGNKVCVTEAKVFNDENKVIALATGTFYVLPAK
ncbi:PaaI family thioesterase [Bacillus sp. FJAT-44742]|uniref:PaaI family thioesterase n=1 Tax=Bacillus sp. FJAT-44742 TaxID=2014005 RepID=UPI000C23145D|nr:PaaI family thioesterase [Bacillus sp. FJAT-44742]